jgi:hypothetical protein
MHLATESQAHNGVYFRGCVERDEVGNLFDPFSFNNKSCGGMTEVE